MSLQPCVPELLYVDSDILLCVKPAGMPSQADPSGQADLWCYLTDIHPSARLIHRLDTPTGGVMVFGLSQRATARMSMLVQDHTAFKKEYLVVVPKAPDEPMGEFQDFLYHDKRQNKAFVVNKNRKGAKSASLSYRTLTIDEQGFALLLVRLHTGRTHQIRIQMASRGMPLIGDGKYGSREKCPYIGLWSYRMAFPHPITGKLVTADALPNISIKPWNSFADYLQQNPIHDL